MNKIMNKLNLGCGYRKLNGFINVDSDPECLPDKCFDLTSANWPIKDNSIELVMAQHILEHLEGTQPYLTFWKELYRVCKNGATIQIEVPYWKHENFFHDPTHVRAVTAVGIDMFNQERNQQMLKNNGMETKLGFMCKIDFELQGAQYLTDSKNGEVEACQYITKAIKPCRYKI
jgi:predicted SAM-dependent methyltransferase